jgi:hypothetical protein
MEDDDLKLEMMAYKIMADSAEKTSDRRQQANNFFIGVNVAIAAGYTFLVKAEQQALIFLAAGVAVAVCFLWGLTLWYYRSLSSAKFQMLGEFEVEKGIPGYQREWEIFSARHPFGKRKISLALIELIFAVMAGAAHIAAAFVLQNVHEFAKGG